MNLEKHGILFWKDVMLFYYAEKEVFCGLSREKGCIRRGKMVILFRIG